MTTYAGVLGYPVGHSRSPAIHNAAFRKLGMEWFYVAIEVPPERFSQRVLDLPSQGFAGANITIPHKLAAIELADRVSEAAEATGAANTLNFKKGVIEAQNTDVEGIVDALCATGATHTDRLPALVMGAGGAARAAVWALHRIGADPIWLWNRTEERATELVRHLSRYMDVRTIRIVKQPDSVLPGALLIVNATSVGMTSPGVQSGGQNLKQLPISADNFNDRQMVVDLVYRSGETELVRMALRRGLTVVDGLEILVRQGAASFRIWTGREPPLATMRSAAVGRHGCHQGES